jgi:hypothetical protein
MSRPIVRSNTSSMNEKRLRVRACTSVDIGVSADARWNGDPPAAAYRIPATLRALVADERVLGLHLQELTRFV